MSKISIHRVKEDIESGESTMIYYSTRTMWWTHLDTDLVDSTIKGREKTYKSLEKRLDMENLNDTARQQIQEAINEIKYNCTLPVDLEGNVLYMHNDPKGWVDDAEERSYLFGKHGLDAFMQSHHQNCNKGCPKTWEDINNYLDVVDMLKK